MRLNISFISWSARITFALTLFATVLFAAAPTAQAQGDPASTGSIALTPSVQRIDITAGQSSQEDFTVINDGTTPFTFIVYARPFSVKSESYEFQFDASTKYTDIYQWISFEKTSFRLNPGERVNVPYTIFTPANAAPGGHYAIIFAETQPEENQSDSVARKKRVGTIVQASVSGEVQESGEIIDINADFWQPLPPLTVSARVENTGNIDFIATQATKVTDLFGNAKASESKEYTVYPGTIRKIDYKWEKANWLGVYRIEQTVKIPGSEMTHSQLVLIMPRWLIVVFVVLLVAGVGYVILRSRRR